jgi:PAS domain S-box-containing protein
MDIVNVKTKETLRILYLEDNPGDVVLIREMLSDCKDIPFQLESAERLSTAMTFLDSERVDLILADLNLPDSEGIETFEKLIMSFPKIPLIVMSGLQDEELALKAVRNGAQDYLVKGQVDSRLLVRGIRYAIERKISEDKVKESEEKYRQLYNEAPIGYHELDKKGRFIRVNQTEADMLEYSIEELLGKFVFDIIAPYEHKKAIKLFNKKIAGKKELKGFERKYITKDGKQVDVYIEDRLNYDSKGRITGIRSSVQNITDRKLAERALQKSEKRYRSLFESIPDGIYLSTADGKFVDVNPAYVEILGYDNKEDLMKIDIKNDLYVEPEDRDKVTAEELETGMSVFCQRRKDGSIIWVEDRGNYIKDEYGNIAYHEGILRDVTDRILAEEKIRTSLKEKELLLKEIHHRVKNNLQVVSSLLNLQSNTINDEIALSAFKDSINRVSSMALVHEKLYESKNFADIDFKGYLESIMNDVYHFSQLNGRIQFKMDIDEISLGLDDAVPCGLIVNELVSNSLKYAFPNENKGIIEISFKRIENETFHLIVHDNGVGLPAQFDFENNTSLGLNLVKLLSKQIEGRVKYTRDNGTKFKIAFKGYDYAKKKYQK